MESGYRACAAFLILLRTNSKKDQLHNPLPKDKRMLRTQGNIASTHMTAR